MHIQHGDNKQVCTPNTLLSLFHVANKDTADYIGNPITIHVFNSSFKLATARFTNNHALGTRDSSSEVLLYFFERLLQHFDTATIYKHNNATLLNNYHDLIYKTYPQLYENLNNIHIYMEKYYQHQFITVQYIYPNKVYITYQFNGERISMGFKQFEHNNPVIKYDLHAQERAHGIHIERLPITPLLEYVQSQLV